VSSVDVMSKWGRHRRSWQAHIGIAILLTALVQVPTLANVAPSAAAENPVQMENTQPGSSGWNLREAPTGTVEGYADRMSALPGDTVNLKVSTNPVASYRIEVYRLGWYGGMGGRLMTCLPSCSSSATGVTQPVPSPDPTTGLIDARWTTTQSFTVGTDWVSGYYIALLVLTSGPSAGTSAHIPLLVRAPASRTKVMLVQASSNTWEAYNKWGGKRALRT